MNIRKLVRTSTLLMAFATIPAMAQDIDLFMTDNTATSTLPNVLFMLDNSANWDASLFKQGSYWVSKKDVLHEALYQALTDPANANKLATGYSQFTTKTGGKIMAAVKPLTSAYQRTLGRKIYNAAGWTAATPLAINTYVLPNYSSDTTVAPNNWTGHYYQVTVAGTTGATEPAWSTITTGGTIASGSVTLKDMGSVYGATAIQMIQKTNNAPYALTLHENYLYFRGDAPLNGTVDGDQDPSAISGGNYVSPNANETCEKNFIVLIGNGAPDSGENTGAYNALWQLYKNNGVTSPPTVLTLNPNNYASNWGDEYAAFFNSVGDANKVEAGKQPINVYVIAIYDTTATSMTTPQKAALAYLNNVATQGKGGYFAAGNTAQLSAALRKIINEVKAVNSVFASTTLPVSINVRGTNLNQVYMGVFRPDSNKLPDWYGNLKMYKLGYDTSTGTVFLADSTGARADSQVTGFIVSSAASYWTHPTDPNVYKVSAYNNGETQWWWWKPQGQNADPKSDYQDGDLVEKGAAGQWLREHPGKRVLYTCHSCTPGTGLEVFNTTYVSAADLGVNSTDAAATVNLVIGNNAAQTDGYEQVRSMVHGDVLHSRPATINYGPGADDVVVYYGANDGVFHAVKGGESNPSWGYAVGQEIWGFVPPELFTSLPALYYNKVIDSSNPKPYFVDGTIMSLRWEGVNYVYLTMRRGARAIYALSVNDNLGHAPTIAWHKNSTDWPELGQTWSDPNIYYANVNGAKLPVIVMGAGYDTAEDIDVTSGTPDTMGRGVYVLNALTGDIIQYLGNTAHQAGISADVVDSIPGGVKSAGSLDINTGLQSLTVAYAADTGGNIWKLNFLDPNPDNWTMTKVAALGGTGSNNRKFLYMPDVVNRSLGYTAVLVGSGDREHPKDTSVTNYFFMVKDYYNAANNHWPLQVTDLPDASVSGAYTGVEPGWRYPLSGAGEKNTGTALTMNGVVFFNTNLPFGSSGSGSVCIPSLGEARAYQVNLNGQCATGTDQCYTIAPGGGFLPSPVPFTVDINGVPVSGIISGTQVRKPPQAPYGHTTHEFWYKRTLDQ